MRKKCVRPLAAMAVLCLASVGGHAQMNTAKIRGEVRTDFGSAPYFRVSLEEPSRSGVAVAHVDSALDGSFELQNVPFGSYRLVVKNAFGETVKEDMVLINATTPEMEVRLPRMPAPERPTEGRISLLQLQHPPSRKAVKAALEAEKLSAASQHEKAAQKLEEALQDSPDYAEAHSNLAAQWMHLRKYEEGFRESMRAIEIGGPNALDLTNAAFALTSMKRFPEAVQYLRTALRTDGSYARAHLLLGQVLTMRPDTMNEALAHLERAAEEFPSAKPLADRVRARMAHP